MPLPFLLAFVGASVARTASAVVPDPCHLPLAPAALAPFCQLHYHQMPFICDPGGILSRTEAELIDRRLARAGVNVTGCLCPGGSAAHSTCANQPWKDRKARVVRLAVLLVPRADIDAIRKCAHASEGSDSDQRSADASDEQYSSEMSAATVQFARLALRRLLSARHARERCDPDLFVVFVRDWSGRIGPDSSAAKSPFVARLFRRNLAHLAHLSQVERVQSDADAGPFEVILEQLHRALALRLLGVHSIPPQSSVSTSTQHSAATVAMSAEFDPMGPAPQRDGHIPLWAILCSLALVSLALAAMFVAHWVGKRISASHQQKKISLSRLNAASKERGGTARELAEQQPKTSSAGGHSVTFAPGLTRNGGGEGGGRPATGGSVKGSMMFRQFSRKTPTSLGSNGGRVQKI